MIWSLWDLEMDENGGKSVACDPQLWHSLLAGNLCTHPTPSIQWRIECHSSGNIPSLSSSIVIGCTHSTAIIPVSKNCGYQQLNMNWTWTWKILWIETTGQLDTSWDSGFLNSFFSVPPARNQKNIPCSKKYDVLEWPNLKWAKQVPVLQLVGSCNPFAKWYSNWIISLSRATKIKKYI